MAILDPFESWRNSRIQVVVSRWILLSLLIIDHFLGLVQINLISVRLLQVSKWWLQCVSGTIKVQCMWCENQKIRMRGKKKSTSLKTQTKLRKLKQKYFLAISKTNRSHLQVINWTRNLKSAIQGISSCIITVYYNHVLRPFVSGLVFHLIILALPIFQIQCLIMINNCFGQK